MSNKRIKHGSALAERNNQEAMHARYKNAIGALNDLMKDISLTKHRKTLDDVAKAMTRALESEHKWSVKCQELQAQLAANESRIKVALQLSEDDKKAMSTLKNELKTAWNVIEEMKLQNIQSSKQESICRNDENNIETLNKAVEGEEIKEIEINLANSEKSLKEMAEYQDKLMNEIEKLKLQLFELEEELADKEKSIEELTNNLNSKSRQFEETAKENEMTKKELDQLKSSNASKVLDSMKRLDNTSANENKEVKLKQVIAALKKSLLDINKKDQISLEKVKHLIKKNKILNKQLQMAKSQNNLIKLELTEQSKMLHLLSCQCCKFEEKDRKQTITISSLENIRNTYVHMIGILEQDIHELKKKSKYCNGLSHYMKI